MKKYAGLILPAIFMTTVSSAQNKTDQWLQELIYKKGSPTLLQVLDNPAEYRYQLIYTKIDRDKNNTPHFKNYYLHVNSDNYFNPASMVKMPTAFAALEKLNSLDGVVNKHTPMLTDSSYPGQVAVRKDMTAENGLPSIAHYIKRIFLISDNDAYNRVFEFVGQQALNESLWKKGYTNSRITRRFMPLTEEQNRYTNQIRFVQNGQTIYTQPAAASKLVFDFSKKILLGVGHWDKNDSLIHTPMDFTTHNNMPLEDLQQLLQSVLFPQSVRPEQRFQLTDDDYKLLYTYMSELPSESRFPQYDTSEYFDSYTKFFFFKDGKQKIPDYIRIFNKTGWSYGFLTDVSYIVDFKNNVEFMLSGTIYVNKDGILNDNKYEYEETGYPFFKEIGTIIYQHELARKRPYAPDLQAWKLKYD